MAVRFPRACDTRLLLWEFRRARQAPDLNPVTLRNFTVIAVIVNLILAELQLIYSLYQFRGSPIGFIASVCRAQRFQESWIF